MAEAVLGAGFTVVNTQPVKAEMSVGAPKSQAKEPIQLDIIIVCRKETTACTHRPSVPQAIASARAKLGRLRTAGFALSRNDCKIVVFGQLLTTLTAPADAERLAIHTNISIDDLPPDTPAAEPLTQRLLFG